MMHYYYLSAFKYHRETPNMMWALLLWVIPRHKNSVPTLGSRESKEMGCLWARSFLPTVYGWKIDAKRD